VEKSLVLKEQILNS